MKNLIDYIDYEEDFEEVDVNQELEKIQLKSIAEGVLRDIEVTRVKHFKKDIKKIAKEYIRIFFKNKKNKDGKRINKEVLFDKQNIIKLLNINIVESTKIIYSSLENSKEFGIKSKKEDVTNEIKLVNESLKKIYNAKIPQQFAGGMLLMYLEICEGIEFNSSLDTYLYEV